MEKRSSLVAGRCVNFSHPALYRTDPSNSLGLRRNLLRFERPRRCRNGHFSHRRQGSTGFLRCSGRRAHERLLVRPSTISYKLSAYRRLFLYSVAADFFTFSLSSPSVFSLAYDFTFFCAIPPSWRERWGKRYGEVVRPGGVLIILCFPLGMLTSLLFLPLSYNALLTIPFPHSQTENEKVVLLTRSRKKAPTPSSCMPSSSSFSLPHSTRLKLTIPSHPLPVPSSVLSRSSVLQRPFRLLRIYSKIYSKIPGKSSSRGEGRERMLVYRRKE
jgi:hypothetical protein